MPITRLLTSICTFLILSLFSSSVWAQAVHSCDDLESSDYTEATRDYANGNIVVKQQYLEEPAAGATHLLVYVKKNSRNYCFAISPDSDGGIGFSDLDINQMSGQYDSLHGLLLQVPASLWDGDTGSYNPITIRFRVKQDGSRPRVVID